MKRIEDILIERDGMSEAEAGDLVEQAKEELYILIESGDIFSAEEICKDYFGLEPDYLDQLY